MVMVAQGILHPSICLLTLPIQVNPNILENTLGQVNKIAPLTMF
jgi:hypothetical protein